MEKNVGALAEPNGPGHRASHHAPVLARRIPGIRLAQKVDLDTFGAGREPLRRERVTHGATLYHDGMVRFRSGGQSDGRLGLTPSEGEALRRVGGDLGAEDAPERAQRAARRERMRKEATAWTKARERRRAARGEGVREGRRPLS